MRNLQRSCGNISKQRMDHNKLRETPSEPCCAVVQTMFARACDALHSGVRLIYASRGGFGPKRYLLVSQHLPCQGCEREVWLSTGLLDSESDTTSVPSLTHFTRRRLNVWIPVTLGSLCCCGDSRTRPHFSGTIGILVLQTHPCHPSKTKKMHSAAIHPSDDQVTLLRRHRS